MQSIIAAPVRSRSAFTSAAVTAIEPRSPSAVRAGGRRRPRMPRLGRSLAAAWCRAWAACTRCAAAAAAAAGPGGLRPAARPRRLFAAASSASCARLLLLLALACAPRPLSGAAPLPRRCACSSSDAPGAGALLDRAADRADHQLAGADRVVVAGDHVVDRARVAVGVDQADDRDPQAGGLAHRDLLGLQVDDEDGVGQALHVAHAAEVVLELGQLGLHPHPLLGRQQLELAAPPASSVSSCSRVIRCRDRVEVGQQPAQPALVDVGHLAAVGPLLDRVARLLLGADEEHRPAAAGELAGEHGGPSRAAASVWSRSMMWIPSSSPKM